MNENEKKPVQVGRPEQDVNDENSHILLSTEIVAHDDANINSVNSANQAPAQTTSGNSAKKTSKKRDSNSSRMLYPQSKTRTMSVKFYDEQIPAPFTIQYVIEQVRALVSELPRLQVILAMHNQDIKDENDDLWAPSIEKRHYHLIVRGLNDYQFQVLSMLRRLGVVFRPKIDDKLWQNKGVETVGNYSQYALYLTHETDKALANGSKFTYDLNTMWTNGEATTFTDAYLNSCEGLLVANMSLSAVKEIRDGYIRVNRKYTKLSIDEKRAIDAELFDLGYHFGNFDEWLNNQDFVVRADTKRKVYEESYARGAEHRRAEMESKREVINRVCVFIEGASGTGKSYASLGALKQFNLKVLTVEGGGTGKFDHLKADTNAMLVNDDIIPNALNICDDKVCRAYKRQNNNPLWSGEWIIVTYNKSFREWIQDCGIKNEEQIKAMHERFFRCHMVERGGKYYVELDTDKGNHSGLAIPTRGDAQKIQTLVNKFGDFQEAFNEISSSYVKASSDKLDLSRLNASVSKELSAQDAFYKWTTMCQNAVEEIQSKYPTAKVSLGICYFSDFQTAYQNKDKSVLNKFHYSVNGKWDSGTLNFIQ